MNKFIKFLFVTFLFVSSIFSQHPSKILNASEIKLALKKMNVLGSVLYLAAHPDDENTAALAYFSKDRCYRSAYMALTRGDGGQNLVGPEKGDLIGVIRTYELLGARKIDGAEQYFSRAIDFGYTKSPDETSKNWGRDKILADVVWTIRKYKPDVIITRFPQNGIQTHGHHTASAILANEAFKIADDSTKFSEQLKYVDVWQPKRIFWNDWRPRFVEDFDPSGLPFINVGKYNELLGKSYTEISAESRSMHKSQGFGVSGSRGDAYDYFSLTGGDSVRSDIFENIDVTWNRVANSSKVSSLLKNAYENFDEENPAASLPTLLKAYEEINNLNDGYWVDQKKKELLNIIQSCAGLWIEAIAEDYSAAPGRSVKLSFDAINRSDFPLRLKEINIPLTSQKIVLNSDLKNNLNIAFDTTITVPENTEYTQPFWLKEKGSYGRFNIPNQLIRNLPVYSPLTKVQFVIDADGQELRFQTPILYRWTDRVDGELYRELEIRPAVTANLEEEVVIFPDQNSRNIKVRLKSAEANASGNVKLVLPSDWKVEPELIPFDLEKKYEEKVINFSVAPPAKKFVGEMNIEISIDGKTLHKSLIEIKHKHIPVKTVFHEAKAKIVRLDTKKVVNNIGYIMGPGDEVPQSLMQLGYNITQLDDDMIENENLSRYDAIVVGIRAYNTRDRIKYQQGKLMKYVQSGGTLVVQYNVSFGLQTSDIGPYPFKIGRDRVTMENAPVKFADEDSPLLNFPNKISKDDFENWVQERGLYFAEDWSNKYQTVLSWHDPGEDAKLGSLLYAEYGKGVFIYTGISFFRQLPAGVPGAYRLFVNLISAGNK